MKKYWPLTLLSLVCAVALAFLLPSGALTDAARERYEALSGEEVQEDEWGEEYDEEEYDEEASLRIRAVIAMAALSDIAPSTDVFLPVDLFEPGAQPIAENFTENGYDDETISVRMEQLRMFDSDVFIAYVKIASPTQLRTAIAGTKMSKEKTAGTSDIAKAYDAVVAVNGDYYLKAKTGHIVRMGEVYREKPSNDLDMLLIDEYGDFHLCKKGKKVQAAFVEEYKKEYSIINGFLFGPALIIDGEVQQDLTNYGYYAAHSDNPRAGIAQLDKLTYAVVVVNGRTDASEGVTMQEFAEIMASVGAKQAFNLDGGNSATLVFNGEIFNAKPQKERGILDILYFASATEGN